MSDEILGEISDVCGVSLDIIRDSLLDYKETGCHFYLGKDEKGSLGILIAGRARDSSTVKFMKFPCSESQNIVHDIYVREDCRNSGVGKKLLEAFLLDQGEPPLLIVDSNDYRQENPATLQQYYEKQGWKPVDSGGSLTLMMYPQEQYLVLGLQKNYQQR